MYYSNSNKSKQSTMHNYTCIALYACWLKTMAGSHWVAPYMYVYVNKIYFKFSLNL